MTLLDRRHIGIGQSQPGGFPSVAVRLVNGVYNVDDNNTSKPDGYIVSDGVGGFQIDTLASSGLTIQILADASSLSGFRPNIVT